MSEKEYDRVTAVLSPFTGMEFVPQDILDKASARGTLVHKFIQSYFADEFLFTETEEVIPYMNSFREFWKNSEHIFKGGKIEQEKRFFCDDLMITGQVDLIIEMQSRIYLIDWKTSKNKNISWRLQGAAYKYLVSKTTDCSVDNVLFVQLKQGKKPSLHKFETYDEDIEMFRKCLDVYRFFNMKKTRREYEQNID